MIFSIFFMCLFVIHTYCLWSVHSSFYLFLIGCIFLIEFCWFFIVNSLVAWTVKCLPTMRESWVQSLGWEYPLEKEMATHSSTHAWKIPWIEEPSGLQSIGSQKVWHDWVTSLDFTYCEFMSIVIYVICKYFLFSLSFIFIMSLGG